MAKKKSYVSDFERVAEFFKDVPAAHGKVESRRAPALFRHLPMLYSRGSMARYTLLEDEGGNVTVLGKFTIGTAVLTAEAVTYELCRSKLISSAQRNADTLAARIKNL